MNAPDQLPLLNLFEDISSLKDEANTTNTYDAATKNRRVLPEGCDYFRRQEDFDRSYAKYTEQYPELQDAFEILEVVYGTFRTEYYRLVNLTIGFLKSVDQKMWRKDDFEWWDEVRKMEWNIKVLNHHTMPRDFVALVMKIANSINNTYVERPTLNPSLFTSMVNGPTLEERLMNSEVLNVDTKFIRRHLVKLAVNRILSKNRWDSQKTDLPEVGALQKVNFILSDENVVCQLSKESVLDLDDACSSDEEFMARSEKRWRRICLDHFIKGVEECVTLTLMLDRRQYGQIVAPLKSDKRNIGRLQDEEFEAFYPFYYMLATAFYSYHDWPKGSTRPYKKLQAAYSQLSSLFVQEMGLSKTTTHEGLDRARKIIWDTTKLTLPPLK